jgi:hypothetical protein
MKLYATLGSFWPTDDGRGRRCSCCEHRRDELHGGPLCASRVQRVEAENLALALSFDLGRAA